MPWLMYRKDLLSLRLENQGRRLHWNPLDILVNKTMSVGDAYVLVNKVASSGLDSGAER